MKKIMNLLVSLLVLTGLKAQDVDLFQVKLPWSYHGMYQPNSLGNGWKIAPEIGYYFLAVSPEKSYFAPCQHMVTYERNFLVGAYLIPTWQEEWKRETLNDRPKIIVGDPSTSLQNFELGLKFLYIPNPNWYFTFTGGLNLSSRYVKNGVRDSTGRYPFQQSLPLGLEINYFDDNAYLFNKVKLSLKKDNSFYQYQAVKQGGLYLVDTSNNLEEIRTFAIGLEPTVYSANINDFNVDINLLSHWLWFKGEDRFGLVPGENDNFQFGLGIAIRRYQKLEEAIKGEVLFDRYGFQLGLTINSSIFKK